MKPPYDAALVLGVELDADDAPTEEMARRVMAAARAYRDGACARLVLCGGCLPGHRRSEAEVMARMLAALGVPKRFLTLEDQSRDTMENCRNAAALHLRRAVMTARRAGLRADGLAAKTTGRRAGKRLMEACYIADLLLGWQDEGRARPAWTYRLFARMFGEQAKK